MTKILKKKYSEQKINIDINKRIIKEIIYYSNYKEMGARKIKKLIEDKVDDIIINNILKNNSKINNN